MRRRWRSCLSWNGSIWIWIFNGPRVDNGSTNPKSMTLGFSRVSDRWVAVIFLKKHGTCMWILPQVKSIQVKVSVMVSDHLASIAMDVKWWHAVVAGVFLSVKPESISHSHQHALHLRQHSCRLKQVKEKEDPPSFHSMWFLFSTFPTFADTFSPPTNLTHQPT